jgi:DNA polymerase
LREYYPKIFESYSINEDTVGDYMNPRNWRCTMIHSRYLGLPSSLAQVGEVLKIQEEKMTEGKALIRYFCIPYDTVDGVPQFHSPADAPDKWEIFKAYNKRDVEAELEIDQKLSRFPVPDFIWEQFYLDQEINDRGIAIDMELVDAAITLDAQAKAKLSADMCKLTGVENPNSVYQLLDWLEQQGYKSDSLGKAQVKELLKTAKEPVRTVLELRQQLSKSSVKKYTAMKTAVCSDNRVRGMFSFYGASRTGRQSSKLIQIQNLPQNHMPDLTEARALVKYGNYDAVDMLYDDIPDTLSQLIRTAFVPRKGMKFIVADFSAIEMRCSAWLAGEQWVLDTFARGGDIYCETASQMFGVPVVKHGINGHLRQRGKQASLSCSYGGSVGALKAMGALESGMKEEELQPLVDAWRAANPNIVAMWYAIDNAAKQAIKERTTTETHGLKFIYQSGFLFIQLPSGRRLAYVRPRMGENRFGSESITYQGVGTSKHWERLETFGGKLTENCIAEGTLVVTDRGLIPIEKITMDMKIWDGIEWVSHDGLIVQGRKETIRVSGLHMTPEHKILTKKGWIECGKADRLDWADVSLPDSYPACGKQQTRKTSMALQMCLREFDNSIIEEFERQEVSPEILWVHEKCVAEYCNENTWNESSSGVGCMALNEAKVYRFKSSRISQLWWKRHYCLPALAGQFRELLGRYGNYMAKRAGFRQNRQQQRLQPAKLSMDNKKAECKKQTKQSYGRDSIGNYDGCRAFRKDRDWCNNSALPLGARVESRIVVDRTKFSEYVYDIRNCGPRHRFTVWNGKRACIVSNCIQAIARDLLFYSMQTLSHCFIVATVHDEMIIECPQEMSLEAVCEQMSRTPSWAEGLHLRADGYECEFYKKD